jgi:hypothetical protein
MDIEHNNQSKTTIGTITGYCLYVLFLLAICFYSFKRPSYNWDMLAYMAVAVSYENNNATEVHGKVYQLAKQELPPEKYQQLVDSSNAYKTSIAHNANEFNLQMPFYVVKPLYTGMVYLFHKVGFSLTKSTMMPSVIAYFFIGLLLVHWIKKYMQSYAALLLSFLIMLLSPMLQVAKLSTPDCLSAFFVLWAIYFVVEKKAIAVPFVLLLISIFARLDNAILSVLLFPVLAFTGKLEKKLLMKKQLFFLVATVLCYLVVSSGAISYGWNVFYYPSFFTHLNTEHDIHQAFSLVSYLKLALTQVMVGLFFSWLPIFIFLIALLCIKANSSNNKIWCIDQVILLLFLIIILLRFILQPVIADRFYIPYYLVVIVFLIRRYATLMNNRNEATKVSNLTQ